MSENLNRNPQFSIQAPILERIRGNSSPFHLLAIYGDEDDDDMQEEQRQHPMLGIVDYGHDEVAMSPEPEDGEISANNEVMCTEHSTTDSDDVQDGICVLTPSNQATPGQLSEHNHQLGDNLMIGTENESITADSEEVNMVPTEEGEDMDPLAKFLTLPPQDQDQVFG